MEMKIQFELEPSEFIKIKNEKKKLYLDVKNGKAKFVWLKPKDAKGKKLMATLECFYYALPSKLIHLQVITNLGTNDGCNIEL